MNEQIAKEVAKREAMGRKVVVLPFPNLESVTAEPPPKVEIIGLCPNCGTEAAPEYQYCQICGLEVYPF